VDAGQSRALETLSATVSDQNKEVATMIDSLNGLASSIALNSTRTAVIPDMLNRLGTDLQRMQTPLVRKPVDLAPQPVTPAPEPEAAPIPMGAHHHPPLESATVAPPGAIVHYNPLGVMDYWLVPRVQSGVQTMAKVVPISQNNGATFVHNVAEVKDYILTASGDWIAAPETNPKP
jgi:uncharacterized coiled-coil protein SlyX